MKLSFNNIGNYSPLMKTGSQNGIMRQHPKVKNSVVQTLPNPEEIQPENLNKEEKKLFVSMFPESKSDIMKYSFYSRAGKKSEVTIGTLIDKRG